MVVNVGDSRAYLLRGSEIRQISQDQSWVADQVRRGLLSVEEARQHPKRNRLTMSVSAKRPTVTPVTTEVELAKQDIILLCSDGLWGSVPNSLIWAAANEFPPQEAADRLVAFANTSQGPDNISVIIARQQDWKPVQGKSNTNETTTPGIS